MDPHSFVYSAVLLLVVASVAVAIFRHFGLGSILGLLVTGVIVVLAVFLDNLSRKGDTR